ncbi:MAG: hypothetical protein L0Z55_01705 [Planctomycetes bacterium]|nr:hypothetical protein [Planctomycetota bacterium]
MKVMWILIVACALPLAFLASPIYSEESESSAKQPLDLPAGGQGTSEDDEDAPETIVFYGQEIEGDAFFWCLPAYSFCGDTTVFEAIKAEVTDSVNSLSVRSKMDLVAYNSETYVWRPRAQNASQSNKASAISWMDTLTTTESQCLLPAGLTTIDISNACNREGKNMIFLGGNSPHCGASTGAAYEEQCLEELTAANSERTPLHTVFVAAVYTSGQSFWESLAAMNGGTYSVVQ